MRRLTLIDAGCRGGFPQAWLSLLPDVQIFGFDADPFECERLAKLYNRPEICLVPQALADAPGRRKLYRARQPACSSLYPPDPEVIASFPQLGCCTLTGTEEIMATSLDAWASSAGVQAVDLIKMDTQGSELDILRGGAGLLPSVRGLDVEVEFNPIYQGQPLFGDVDAFLRGFGFVLWGFSEQTHYSRGAGNQLFWANALFLSARFAAGEGDEADAALARMLGLGDLALYIEH